MQPLILGRPLEAEEHRSARRCVAAAAAAATTAAATAATAAATASICTVGMHGEEAVRPPPLGLRRDEEDAPRRGRRPPASATPVSTNESRILPVLRSRLPLCCPHSLGAKPLGELLVGIEGGGVDDPRARDRGRAPRALVHLRVLLKVGELLVDGGSLVLQSVVIGRSRGGHLGLSFIGLLTRFFRHRRGRRLLRCGRW